MFVLENVCTSVSLSAIQGNRLIPIIPFRSCGSMNGMLKSQV